MPNYPAFTVSLTPEVAELLNLPPGARLVIIDRTSGQVDPSPDACYLSCAELARRYRLNCEALRKKLARWMPDHQDGWVEVEEPARNRPRFLYREDAVQAMMKAA